MECEVYFGTKMGPIIQINYRHGQSEQIILPQSEKSAVTALLWDKGDIVIGYKNGAVYRYNPKERVTKIRFKNIDETIVGVVSLLDHGNLMIATKSGNLYTTAGNTSSAYKVNPYGQKSFETLVANPYVTNIVGSGGINNDVQLYDLSTSETIFQGKADHHDELNLQKPISVKDLTFLKDSDNMVATATAEGQIRLYDIRTQSRPIKIYEDKSSTYTKIISNTITEFIVGLATGSIHVVDIRFSSEPKVIKKYGEIMDSVTGLNCLSTIRPLLLSSSLDGFFRVHDLSSEDTPVKFPKNPAIREMWTKAIRDQTGSQHPTVIFAQ